MVAECKYWEARVDRQTVDALATTVREVGAARGVIFSKEGFQTGAITQAKHENIDLFQVRSLTEEEWGLPGREIEFFMHCHTASAGCLSLTNVQPIPGCQPKSPNLNIVHGSTQTKMNFPGSGLEILEALVEKYAFKACDDANFATVIRFEKSLDGDILIRRHVTIAPPTPIQIFFNDGGVFVGSIAFDVGHKIAQTRIYIDRAKNLLFALAIEDVVNKTKLLASRRSEDTDTVLVEPCDDSGQPPTASVLKNGTLISYWIRKLIPFEEFASLKLGELSFVKRDTSRALKK